jgi:hypothetical protein
VFSYKTEFWNSDGTANGEDQRLLSTGWAIREFGDGYTRVKDRITAHQEWASEVRDAFLDSLRFLLAHEMAHVYRRDGDLLCTCEAADTNALKLLQYTYGRASLGAFESMLLPVANGYDRYKWNVTPEGAHRLKLRYDNLLELLKRQRKPVNTKEN